MCVSIFKFEYIWFWLIKKYKINFLYHVKNTIERDNNC
jgi:hypothetical protein